MRDVIGGASGWAFGNVASGVATWVLGAVSDLISGVVGFLGSSTQPSLEAAWFSGPGSPFAAVRGIASSLLLGFVFLVIGVAWSVQAFAERAFNEMWWITLITGILLVILAFWTSGQFVLERAYTLLIFAGIWALFKGITDIVRAFEIRKLA